MNCNTDKEIQESLDKLPDDFKNENMIMKPNGDWVLKAGYLNNLLNIMKSIEKIEINTEEIKNLTNIMNDVDNLQAVINDISNLTAIISEIEAMNIDLNDVSSIKTAIESVETLNTNIDGDLTTLVNKIGSVGTANTIVDNLENLQAIISNIENLTAIIPDIDNLNTKITSIENMITTIQTKQLSIQADINTVKDLDIDINNQSYQGYSESFNVSPGDLSYNLTIDNRNKNRQINSIRFSAASDGNLDLQLRVLGKYGDITSWIDLLTKNIYGVGNEISKTYRFTESDYINIAIVNYDTNNNVEGELRVFFSKSGLRNPATRDLDMGGYDINNAGNLYGTLQYDDDDLNSYDIIESDLTIDGSYHECDFDSYKTVPSGAIGFMARILIRDTAGGDKWVSFRDTSQSGNYQTVSMNTYTHNDWILQTNPIPLDSNHNFDYKADSAIDNIRIIVLWWILE